MGLKSAKECAPAMTMPPMATTGDGECRPGEPCSMPHMGPQGDWGKDGPPMDE